LPAFGAALGNANDGLAALHYSFVGGNTIVFADSDDDGVFDADDFAVKLTGTQALVQSDFRLINDNGDTNFVIAGTNGADTINGTEGPTRFSGSAAMTRSTAVAAATGSRAAMATTRSTAATERNLRTRPTTSSMAVLAPIR
jgi:hypothetical protein